MTVGKATALTAGFIGAFALGVWIGPHIMHRDASQPVAVQQDVQPAAVPDTPLPAPARRPAARASASPAAAAPAASTVAVSAPELQRKLKPLLRSGANMQVAGEGFASAEQFASTAHAAKNTDVPFMVLKNRVVDERKSLKTRCGVEAEHRCEG
jgi:hypothetical protein